MTAVISWSDLLPLALSVAPAETIARFDFGFPHPLMLSVAPAQTVAHFDFGRFAAYAQCERKLGGAKSKRAQRERKLGGAKSKYAQRERLLVGAEPKGRNQRKRSPS